MQVILFYFSLFIKKKEKKYKLVIVASANLFQFKIFCEIKKVQKGSSIQIRKILFR